MKGNIWRQSFPECCSFFFWELVVCCRHSRQLFSGCFLISEGWAWSGAKGKGCCNWAGVICWSIVLCHLLTLVIQSKISGVEEERSDMLNLPRVIRSCGTQTLDYGPGRVVSCFRGQVRLNPTPSFHVHNKNIKKKSRKWFRVEKETKRDLTQFILRDSHPIQWLGSSLLYCAFEWV